MDHDETMNFCRRPHKHHSCNVSVQKAVRFQKKWLKCAKFTQRDRRITDDGCQMMTKAHFTLWVKWAKNVPLIQLYILIKVYLLVRTAAFIYLTFPPISVIFKHFCFSHWGTQTLGLFLHLGLSPSRIYHHRRRQVSIV